MTGVKEHRKWAGICGSEEPTTPEVTTAGSKNEQTNLSSPLSLLFFFHTNFFLFSLVHFHFCDHNVSNKKSKYIKISGELVVLLMNEAIRSFRLLQLIKIGA